MSNDPHAAILRLQHFKTALEFERAEERKLHNEQLLRATLEIRKRRGITWHPVKIIQEQWAFGDLLEIDLQHVGQAFESNSFGTGKNIQFFSTQVNESAFRPVNATIKRLEQDRMTVLCSLDHLPEWCYESGLGINLQIDEHSYEEMQAALDRAIKAKNSRVLEWAEILAQQRQPIFKTLPISRISECNASQQRAVENCLGALDVAVIFGPPGTGKTRTLVETIFQTVQREHQVLVCAPTNTALDILTERLLHKRLRVLRLGHPARISETLLSSSLDAQVEASAYGKTIKEYRKIAEAHFRQASKYSRSYGPQQARQKTEHYNEAKALLKEARQLEQHAVYELFNSAQVICCTPVTSMHHGLSRRTFKTLFVDEASQIMEPMVWIPLVRCERLILAGDPHQLPPLVRSAQAQILSNSILDTCMQFKEAASLLQIQYRMHKTIMQYSNLHFYSGRLEADVSVENHSLNFEDADWNTPLVFIDTSGCGFEEWQNPETLSYKNCEESRILWNHLKALNSAAETSSGIPLRVGILTPYRQQRQQLQEDSKHYQLNHLMLEVKTIDGFQGDECDVIYISLVRNNPTGELGFLNDLRRMNVALTRARKKLVVIGDGATLARHPFYKSWMEFAENQGRLESAFQWI